MKPSKTVRTKQSVHRRRRYYNILAEKHGEVCSICKVPSTEQKLFVDHDHSTGKVRGLLCRNCNFGLGLFQDDVDRLVGAINYLNRPHWSVRDEDQTKYRLIENCLVFDWSKTSNCPKEPNSGPEPLQLLLQFKPAYE